MTTQTAEDRIKQSKGWRQGLDVILQQMKDQIKDESQGPPTEDGRHLKLAVNNLEDVIMRQGMRMKCINEACPGTAENPYPESYNPAHAKVEPTADGIKL